VQQPGSPNVLMPTTQVVEPSPTTRVLSGKVPITETPWVQLSSSSSEEHEYYSGEEVDFGDEPALPDTSKFSHISEEEMQAYVPAMVLPSGEIATADVISSILFNCFSIKLERCLTLHLKGVANGSEATTSSHIEKMIQELAQQEGLEVPATGMPHEDVTTEIGEPSSPSGLSKDLSSSDPQLGKRIKMCCILSFSLLSLTLMLWLQRVPG